MMGALGTSFVLKCVVTAIALSGLTQWYLSRRKRRTEEDALAAQHGCQPVKATLPYKWPFAIDLLKLQYDALPQCRMLEFQTKYFSMASTIRMDILGTGYIITDPVNIEAILNSRFEDFVLGSRREGLFPLLGEGIFTQDGPAWKHSREILRHQFVHVRSLGLDALEPHAMELLDAIAKEAKESPENIVDLQPHFFEYTLGTTTDLLFGEPHSSLPQADRLALRDNFDYASMVSAMRLRLADLAWLYTPKRFKKACRGVRDWASFFASKAIDHFEDHGEASAKEKYGFIVDLWKSLKDRTLVRDQLLHVLTAGRDTTACLLSWTFFHLVRNPELLVRLKKEIATVITSADQNITRENIKQLPFLDCCLKETLRLYPQLPVNVRYAARTTILPRGGGDNGNAPVLLRKGNGVGWSAYHLHRREALYGPDATEYRPDRWASGELIRKVGLGSGFLDFHAGPRVCLGKDYALMEASYGVVRLLMRYPNIRLPPSVPNLPVGQEKQNLTIVLSSAEGVKVLLD
ncbi:cytochrome P450 CYP4/CYP19/CYP26 subfamilies protein [Colletotrichum karsti]|uniref:Cytochrome P450 CYP4/CYP19/CYP26 subfamilies protein n=1 Tax=Colletotrichum karsti TaxID=1095194 RepID=A0A9P6LIX3_9PEZI|nr:cytochrome P450 CYP4/CYP19/CYP26 subfamilies protein [Colletotrichum karsti]KAF9875098.1 cytochrome P450 CYP4/CYP19/CYP26 subfamilies protein [Colletotrichum karsti]